MQIHAALMEIQSMLDPDCQELVEAALEAHAAGKIELTIDCVVCAWRWSLGLPEEIGSRLH